MADEPNSYWVLGWLDQTGVESLDEIGRQLADFRKRHEMRELAEAWKEAVVNTQPTGLNLVAGTGLNFADRLTCPTPVCRMNQIDVLFRHAWHYFDTDYVFDESQRLQ